LKSGGFHPPRSTAKVEGGEKEETRDRVKILGGKKAGQNVLEKWSAT